MSATRLTTNTRTLLAGLPCVLLLAACATAPRYPVAVNLQVDHAPMRSYLLQLGPGQTQTLEVAPGYLVEARLAPQSDGLALASVALSAQAGGAALGSLVSPPLRTGQAYDAYFVICTAPAGLLVTGGLHGQVRLDQAPVRPSCMLDAR